jgi:PHP family Zn ribbon phosphoesterase
MNGMKKNSPGPLEIDFTIEYYPEEGKYHFTGHRNCKVKFNPLETAQQGTTCPVCGRELTVGVLHRIEELSKRELITTQDLRDLNAVIWKHHSQYGKFVHMVPLLEILSESYRVSIQTKKVTTAYNTLLENLGSELDILLTVDISNIKQVGGDKVAQGIQKVREGNLTIDPGYDGEYGKVSIWNNEEIMQPEQLKMI